MATKKILALLLFSFAACLIVVYGFSLEVKTFGVTGKILFEDENSAGTIIIFTTGNDSPLVGEHKKFVEETTLEDGHFYRPINELGGRDINIWIKKNGYPIVHSTRVLNPNQKQIDFGEIFIPRTLRTEKLDDAIAVKHRIQGYQDMCLEGQSEPIDISQIKCIRNFTKEHIRNGECNNLKTRTVYNADFSYDLDLNKGVDNSIKDKNMYFKY